MIEQWRFTFQGKTGGGVDWKTEGECVGDIADNSVFSDAMRRSFQQLTGGKAIFGSPGAGCRGPYSITSFRLEKVVH